MKKGGLIILIILLVVLGIYFLNYSTSGNAILKFNKDKFCGRSTSAYCTASEQCIPGGCGYQLCGGISEYKEPTKFCKTKTCYNATRYNLECTCYKNLCQWKNKIISSP